MTLDGLAGAIELDIDEVRCASRVALPGIRRSSVDRVAILRRPPREPQRIVIMSSSMPRPPSHQGSFLDLDYDYIASASKCAPQAHVFIDPARRTGSVFRNKRVQAFRVSILKPTSTTSGRPGVEVYKSIRQMTRAPTVPGYALSTAGAIGATLVAAAAADGWPVAITTTLARTPKPSQTKIKSAGGRASRWKAIWNLHISPTSSADHAGWGSVCCWSTPRLFEYDTSPNISREI